PLGGGAASLAWSAEHHAREVIRGVVLDELANLSRVRRTERCEAGNLIQREVTREQAQRFRLHAWLTEGRSDLSGHPLRFPERQRGMRVGTRVETDRTVLPGAV